MIIESRIKSYSYDKLVYSNIHKDSYNLKGNKIKSTIINYYSSISRQDTSFLNYYNYRYDDYDNIIYKEESLDLLV